MTLFVLGDFTMHSGDVGRWKIECDALTDEDVECLAFMLWERLDPFSSVEGVPRGGLRLASALYQYATSDAYQALIVDDVLTTGASMNGQRNGRSLCRGAVIFARGPCPSWITPLFQLSPTEAG